MRVDRNMEDAAVMAGVPRFRAFCDITLTSLTPSLLAVGMFMFVETLRLFKRLGASPAGEAQTIANLYLAIDAVRRGLSITEMISDDA